MSRLKVLYGFHAVTARLRADASTIEEVLYDPTRKDRRMQDFLRAAKEAGVRLIAADESRLWGLAGNVGHQGVVARAHENPSAGWVVFVFIFQFLVGIYGGYFGGGIGILMLAALGLIGLTDMHEMNGLKNLLAICINGIAALYFAFGGAVLWRDGAIMAAAAIVGGYLGARIAHRFGRTFVRRAVVLIGLAMGIAMFFKR